MAPEIIQKKEYSGFNSDIWSLGIILFVMLAGIFPFNGGTEKDLYGKICRGGLFHMPETIPFEARHLISSLLHFDPIKRPTIKQVRSGYNHTNSFAKTGGFVRQRLEQMF